jgi:hypothetical protein
VVTNQGSRPVWLHVNDTKQLALSNPARFLPRMTRAREDGQTNDAFAVMQRAAAAKGKAKAVIQPERQVADLPWCVRLLSTPLPASVTDSNDL